MKTTTSHAHHLTRMAVALFDAMHRAVEDRAEPIIEHYLDDFYKSDRDLVSDLYSADADFLWLQHPNGSHFNRIGVLHPDHCFMSAVLDSYQSAHPMHRMELRHIRTDSQGSFKMRILDFDAARQLMRTPKYQLQGTQVQAGAGSGIVTVASIDTRLVAKGPGIFQGDIKITSSHGGLSREQAVATVMLARRELCRMTGSLFTGVKQMQIDGIDTAVALPSLDIPEVVPGIYAPEAETDRRAARHRA